MCLKYKDWNIEAITGYKPKTTFYMDFSIAEPFGLNAIKDTYRRAFSEWKTNTEYVTELVMVLNWKVWEFYGKIEENIDPSKTETYHAFYELYLKLYETLNDWCFDNLKGEDLEYFIRTTD